jgi:hypothetical protein
MPQHVTPPRRTRRHATEHVARAAAAYARLAPIDRALLDDDLELTPTCPCPASRNGHPSEA